MTIVPDLSDLVIEQVSITNDVMITVHAASPTASCPCCGTISKRVQSWYTRILRDLPASGRLVHLIVRVRRFSCQESTCVRKIFAERFPSLTLPRVKFTRPTSLWPPLHEWLALMIGVRHEVAGIAVRTLERRILPGILLSVPCQAESRAPGTM